MTRSPCVEQQCTHAHTQKNLINVLPNKQLVLDRRLDRLWRHVRCCSPSVLVSGPARRRARGVGGGGHDGEADGEGARHLLQDGCGGGVLGLLALPLQRAHGLRPQLRRQLVPAGQLPDHRLVLVHRQRAAGHGEARLRLHDWQVKLRSVSRRKARQDVSAVVGMS
jgi:hypothetical protein